MTNTNALIAKARAKANKFNAPVVLAISNRPATFKLLRTFSAERQEAIRVGSCESAIELVIEPGA